MYNLESSTQFKKDYKVLSLSDTKLLETALGILANTGLCLTIPILHIRLRANTRTIWKPIFVPICF